MKRCSTCKTEKPASDFYRRARSKDGLGSQCRACHCAGTMRTRDLERKREHNRRWMQAYAQRPEVKERERKRAATKNRTPHARVRFAVATAVRAGRLVPPPACERCFRTRKLNAHHHDYSRPLDVEWLCTECHGIEHRRAS